MTKLSAGMERFLARLTGPECMAKRDACDQAAALIRVYEEAREAKKRLALALCAVEASGNDGADVWEAEQAQIQLDTATLALEAIKAELEE